MMDVFSQYRTEEISPIANEVENRKCFQCQASPSNWICVLNGIFLCAACAGELRSFGSRISCIKSLIFDKLNPFQIATMKEGGNVKAKELLSSHWKDYKVYERIVVFSSKLMEYHRNALYDCIVGNPIQSMVEASEVTEIMEKSTVQRPILMEVPLKKVKEEFEDTPEIEPQEEAEEDANEENQVNEENKPKKEEEQQQKEESNKEEEEQQSDSKEEKSENNVKEPKEEKKDDDNIIITKEVSNEPFVKEETKTKESSNKSKYKVAEGKTKETSDCALQ